MKFKGTPGVWSQSHREKEDGMYSTEVYTEENPNEVICTMHWYPNREIKGITSTYREANAKLISAAPELLEFAIEMVNRYPNSPWIYEEANRAINKALGL